MQNQLTLFDSDLVPFFKTQYLLAKTLYFTFTDDFDLADKADDPQNMYYSPVDELSNEELRIAATLHDIEIPTPYLRSILEQVLEDEYPQRYYKQGILTGMIDNLVENMIVQEPDGRVIPISYGKFNEKYFKDTVREPFDKIVYLFLNFHPEKRPVLWRILIAQAHIYFAIMKAREMRMDFESQKPPAVLEMMTEKEWIKRFSWRPESKEYSKEEIYTKHFDVVKNYLSCRLDGIMKDPSCDEK